MFAYHAHQRMKFPGLNSFLKEAALHVTLPSFHGVVP
jgi:hypothetical protein